MKASAITFFKLHFRVLEIPLTLNFILLQRTQKIKFPRSSDIIKVASHDFLNTLCQEEMHSQNYYQLYDLDSCCRGLHLQMLPTSQQAIAFCTVQAPQKVGLSINDMQYRKTPSSSVGTISIRN